MLLTICTPSYNRLYTLERVYTSLIEQTNKDFEWLIIDDGSTDQTEIKVKKWIDESKINIKYYYQENKGKHIALNKGISLAKGDLFTCLDSDDWFYPTTVEEISMISSKIINDESVAAIVGLDTYGNGDIVGTNFDSVKESSINWIDLIYKYEIKGDKAYFYKTNILKKTPFYSYERNKHMPPDYQDYQISKYYNYVIYNNPLKYIEYLEDGISKNKYNKYLVAPDNFSYYRLSIAELIPNKKRKIMNAIHFNATQYLGEVKIVPIDFKTRILFRTFKSIGYLLAIFIKRKANYSTNISHNINRKN